MEANTFATDASVMIDLGLNPGLVENYLEVSLEPVRFERQEGFSWGSSWTAVHVARYHNGGKVEVDGRGFDVHTAKPTTKRLLEAWRKEQKRRDDEAYWDERDVG